MVDQTEPAPEPSLDGDSVTWEEAVLWSMRPKSERCLANPEYADFAKRYETSRLREVFEASIHPIPQGETAQ